MNFIVANQSMIIIIDDYVSHKTLIDLVLRSVVTNIIPPTEGVRSAPVLNTFYWEQCNAG